jgi:H+/Cl- antiporter ClcA
MAQDKKTTAHDKHSVEGISDRFLEPLAGFRLGFISLLAALIGILAGLIAYVLYDLIGLFTNLAYYHEWSFHFRSPENTHLGPWIIVTPVIGGLIVGFMAKYGSEKIKGHGIPEAMEAVLTSRSRIEAKVAILKPLSAAIAIGTGGPFGAEARSFRRAERLGRSWGSSFPRRLPSERCCSRAALAREWQQRLTRRLRA